MTREDIHSLWAPASSIWAQWVKPVLFSFLNDDNPITTGWIPSSPLVAFDPTTTMVVDLHGPESVAMGMALVRLGWRPVPVFNAVPRPTIRRLHDGQRHTVVDVEAIIDMLLLATPWLSEQVISDNAPPAFLLDSRRAGPGGQPSPLSFDNRSIHFTTDFPSALYLQTHGIERVTLLHPEHAPRPDVAHTLRAWQDGGLPLFHASPESPNQSLDLVVEKPSQFGMLWQRALAAVGLRRSPFGGFGGIVPEPGSAG